MSRRPHLHVVREYPITCNPRVPFNPRNREHMLSYAYYLKYDKWGVNGCRFELEDQYMSIPDMIKDKVLDYYLETLKEQV